jgi:hypothetical protein
VNIIEREIRASYDFFFDHLNNDPASPGYGLVSDNDAKPEMASIACVGFALSGFVIGVERGWMAKADLLQLVRGTLRTFIDRVPHYKGFFVHFVERSTGEQYRKSEYSTIDTVLFLNGAMTATAYLNDPEAFELLDMLFDRIDFEHFVFDYKGRPTFRMAYNPLKGGAYSDGTGNPWIYHWHMTAEQLSMYVLAAGSKHLAPELARGLYLGFDRKPCDYKGHRYFYSPSNGLFVYQYSHAWIDFQTYRAPDVDWFENSRQATLGNYQWCVDHQDEFSTLSTRMWGLTACLTQKGYRPQGVQPTDLPNGEHECFNVYPPSGPAGSAPFCQDLVFDTLVWLDQVHPQAFGRYGFVDGIEKLADGSYWYCPHVIGINKGVTLLMLDNALSQTTWKYYHAHPIIQKGLEVLEFTRKKG